MRGISTPALVAVLILTQWGPAAAQVDVTADLLGTGHEEREDAGGLCPSEQAFTAGVYDAVVQLQAGGDSAGCDSEWAAFAEFDFSAVGAGGLVEAATLHLRYTGYGDDAMGLPYIGVFGYAWAGGPVVLPRDDLDPQSALAVFAPTSVTNVDIAVDVTGYVADLVEQEVFRTGFLVCGAYSEVGYNDLVYFGGAGYGNPPRLVITMTSPVPGSSLGLERAEVGLPLKSAPLAMGCATKIVSSPGLWRPRAFSCAPVRQRPTGVTDLRARLGRISHDTLPLARQTPRFDLPCIVERPPRRQRHTRREYPFIQDVTHGQRMFEHPPGHGRRRAAPDFLPPALHVVPPNQEDRQPFRAGLPPLRPGDRFALMVRTAVPDQHVIQVDDPQRITRVPPLLARRHPMVDPRRKASHRPRIGAVVVAVDRHLRLTADDHLQQLAHILAHGMGIRSAERLLERGAASLLCGCHRSAAPNLAVGEVGKEVGVLFYGDVMVKRLVLRLLEGDEPVDNDLAQGAGTGHHSGMEDHAMPTKASELAVDSRRRNAQVPGDLAVGHAADGLGQELGIDVGADATSRSC